MLTAIVFILMLAVLILVHEAGHFTLAKIFHVTVKEFGLGFGPRIFGIKRGETEYTLNAVPLGGFVKMVGEEDPNLPGSLAGKPIGVRALVLSSGALMNIVLPIILLTASFMVPHQVLRETVYIDDVAPGSPAAIAGVKPGDVVLKMDGHKVRNRTDVSYRIALRFGSQVKLTLRSEGASPREVIVKTRWNPPEGQGPTGIRIGGSDSRIDTESLPIWQAFPRGAATVWETLVLFKNEVEGWFIRRTAPQVAGPIGIAQATGEIARAGISPIFRFASLLSLNLAIFNLLPLPALDGGRLAFVLVEWIRRGKRVSPQKEGMVHLIGFIVLLSLMALVTYLDINRIISGTSLFP
ncbi:MAG: site-2 protease family protein [Chloroflexi bacterium]|nr:site-2 protease family protein [Chloroflexota bacterium]